MNIEENVVIFGAVSVVSAVMLTMACQSRAKKLIARLISKRGIELQVSSRHRHLHLSSLNCSSVRDQLVVPADARCMHLGAHAHAAPPPRLAPATPPPVPLAPSQRKYLWMRSLASGSRQPARTRTRRPRPRPRCLSLLPLPPLPLLPPLFPAQLPALPPTSLYFSLHPAVSGGSERSGAGMRETKTVSVM